MRRNGAAIDVNLVVFGKLLLGLGAGIALLGIAVLLIGQTGLTRLPGDLVYRSGRSVFYVPLVTCIVVSILASLVLNLIAHFRR